MTPSPVTYEGPASIQSYLATSERDRGRGGSMLFAATPFYAAVDPHPIGAAALAEHLRATLGIDVDLVAVDEQRTVLDAQLRQLMARSEGMRELVRNLEAEADRQSAQAPVSPSAVGGLLNEISDFLRTRRGNEAIDRDSSRVSGSAEA